MSVTAITHLDISMAAQMGDLDAACLHLQQIAGITDGGIAAHCFSDVQWSWEEASLESRERKLRTWLLVERIHAEGGARDLGQ